MRARVPIIYSSHGLREFKTCSVYILYMQLIFTLQSLLPILPVLHAQTARFVLSKGLFRHALPAILPLAIYC